MLVWARWRNCVVYCAMLWYNFTKNADTTIQTIDKVEEDIESEGNIMKYIALSLSAVFCFMYGIVAVRTIKDIKQELKEKDDA